MGRKLKIQKYVKSKPQTLKNQHQRKITRKIRKKLEAKTKHSISKYIKGSTIAQRNIYNEKHI